MPKIKPFNPGLEHKLEELFNHNNGKMPCKGERIRLGGPYDESPMRIQCWFTKRSKTRRSRTSNFPSTDSEHAHPVSRSLRSERHFQRELPFICIEFLERRFMKEGPRLPSEKARQRISETYNVSHLSIEEWWHHRQSIGGKLCSPRKHRGGKLAELEVSKRERIDPRQLSFSQNSPPSNKVLIAKSILPFSPPGSIGFSSATTASSFLEISLPSSGGSRALYPVAGLNQESARPHPIRRSPSTLLAPGLSLSESGIIPAPPAKDVTITTAPSRPSTPSHTLGPAISLSLASPLLLQTCTSVSTEDSFADGHRFHLFSDLTYRGPDVTLDLDFDTVKTQRQRERRSVSRSISYSSFSHTAYIHAASWRESEAFGEPGGPHWRLVHQDLNAALKYKRNRTLWTSSGDSLRFNSERHVLDSGLCDTSGGSLDLLETGHTATNGEVEKLLLEFVDCGDDSQRQEILQRLDASNRRLSRINCVSPERTDLERQRSLSVIRPSTPYSNLTPRFHRLSTPADPGLCSPGSTHASSPCIESLEASPLVCDRDWPVFMKETTHGAFDH